MCLPIGFLFVQRFSVDCWDVHLRKSIGLFPGGCHVFLSYADPATFFEEYCSWPPSASDNGDTVDSTGFAFKSCNYMLSKVSGDVAGRAFVGALSDASMGSAFYGIGSPNTKTKREREREMEGSRQRGTATERE